MKNITKVLLSGAVATLLLPSLALAHDGGDKNKLGLQVRIEKGIERVEKKDSRDERKDERHDKRATTTAAAITKQATRIQVAADTMLSFNTRIGALIASSSAEGKAALEAKFASFQAAAGSAKVEAGKAITTSAQVNANNSTTTNATLLASAKVDLREAKGFLHDAKEALFSILRSLWN